MRSVWGGLAPQRRIVVVLATVAMFAAVLGLARMATQPGLSLLYSGLENGAAGEVVQALEARGVAYDIRGNAIFVDTTRRDELRLTLASEGLPSAASQGYELLDSLTGFGTTSQMFDAAYWRAKEGELARTIVASPAIQAARVHIANPGTKPFQRDLPPTASVTVTPAGGALASSHAQALRYLVASAVAGLSADSVSVIDGNGGTILSSDQVPQAGGMADRAAALKRNAERLLEARVGYGNAVVEVNVETVTASERITERTIDPESRVAISRDVTETADTSTDEGGGDVTVASNLPDGDAAAGGDRSQSERSETRERVNYEVSEVQRDVTREPGAIARVTTAVLVDGIRTPGADGADEWVPRPEEEMEALRELVASAVGFDEARGDALTLKTMQFEPLPTDGSAPASGFGLPMAVDAMRLAQLGILALVALLIGLFVVRPILSQKAQAPLPALSHRDDGAGDARGAAEGAALTGEIDPSDVPDHALPVVSDRSAMGDPSANAVERLRALIDERQEESMEILKTWMEDDGEKA